MPRDMSLTILLGVYLPALLALACAFMGIVAARQVRPQVDSSSSFRKGTVLAVVALGAVTIGFRMVGADPFRLGVALTLVMSLGIFPVLAMFAAPQDDVSCRRLSRGVLWILGAMALLIVAESFQRTVGVSRTLVMQAVDQVGEIRLAQFHPGSRLPPMSWSLLVQLLLVFPFFTFFLAQMIPGVPLLWNLGLTPILQYFWSAPAGLVAQAAMPRRSGTSGPLAVLALAIALHPVVLDKSSWDFIPPGTLLFLLAWRFERTNARWPLILALGIGAWAHPVQSVMAALWAADHARRNWKVTPPQDRRGLLAVPVVVWAMAAMPVLALGIPALAGDGPSLMNQLAPYARRQVAWHMTHGHFDWFALMVGSNVLKLFFLLLPLGFLPVLRWNRFLAYGLVEVVYSLGTPNGFIHGSLPGFVGLLACAALDNALRIRLPTLRRSAWIAAIAILPLTIAWSEQHSAVQLLRNATSDRVEAVEGMIRPGDRLLTCVGQGSTYPVLAGRCGGEGVLRFADKVPGSNARTADVYLLELSHPPWPRRTEGIRGMIEELASALSTNPDIPMDYLNFHEEPSVPDLLWLKDSILAGELTVTEFRNGWLRLDRMPSPTLRPTPATAEALGWIERRLADGLAR